MVTSLISSFHVFARRASCNCCKFLTRYKHFANHRSKLPENWRKNKVPKRFVDFVGKMDVAATEQVLSPFRLSVKEQVIYPSVVLFAGVISEALLKI